MMNKLIFLVLIAALASTAGAAEPVFPVDFQEAMRLARTPGKEGEAETMFLELAERQARSRQGLEAALEQASLCALRRKDFEEAEKRAGRIQDKPLQTLCRMRIWDAQLRWTNIVEAAGSQDFVTWPDRLVYDAAMCRARAHAMLGEAAAAEKDFLLAQTSTFDANQLASANLNLGNLYRDQLKDENKALAAYRAVIESPVLGAAKYDGVIAFAVLQAKKGDEKEAIAQLDKLKMETIPSADWRCRIQQAYGDVYAALKRPDAALAAYRKALEIPEVSKYMVKAIEERIAGMTPK